MGAYTILVLGMLAMTGMILPATAETIKQTMEGGMDIEITYPDAVIVGKDFAVSFLIQNNGWEDKEQVSFVFDPNDDIVTTKKGISIDQITAGSSYGETVDFAVKADASLGSHFLNLDYSQVLLENNETPREPTYTNIALELDIREQSRVNIHTITPESIFAQAEFPFEIELFSKDTNLNDVQLEIIAPDDIGFRGETLHTFSFIQKGEIVSITSRIITPTEQIQTEYKVPFQIILRYTDDSDEQKEDSKTVSLVLRPRTYMELTTDGGIWVGDFFIAPYISLGTIIGIPAGAIFSLIIKKRSGGTKKRGAKKT